MKNILVAFILGILSSDFCFSQEKHFALDFGLGYKSNISTFGIGLDYCTAKNKLEFLLSSSFHFGFASSGFTTGIRYNFLTEKRITPSVQCSYRYLFPSRNISVGIDNDRIIGTYAVKQSHSVVPQIGLSYNLDGDAIKAKSTIISLNLNYLFPLNNVYAQYVKGDRSSEIEHMINARYRQGIGFSITCTEFF